MRIKKTKKHKRVVKAKNRISFTSLSFIAITLSVLFIALLINFNAPSYNQTNTLGATTFLAKGDNSGSENSGSESSGSNSSESNSSDDDNGDDSNDDSGESGNNSNSEKDISVDGDDDSSGNDPESESTNFVSSNSMVECTGPDGKKFITKFKDCEELNKAWGNANFNFRIKSPEFKIKKETRPQKIEPTEPLEDIDKLEKEDENEQEENIRTKTEKKQNESKTEIRFSDTEQFKTRTKDGLTRIDITSAGIKTRLERKEDRVIIRAQQEDGTEVELEDDTLFKIGERLSEKGIRVASVGAEKLIIQKGIAGAVTDFPISVNLADNTLSIDTPLGQRTITVLPDEAVQNLLALNVIDNIGGQAVIDKTLTGNLSSLSQLAKLETQNGIPVYRINGLSDQKLLGFVPVSIEKNITVSAQTGDVVIAQSNFINNFLDFISF